MSRTVTLAGYAVLAVAVLGAQVAGLASRRMATFGQAVAAAARRRTGRWPLLAGWLWVGWHLFVRSNGAT